MKLQSVLSVGIFCVFLSVGFSQCSTMKLSETIELQKEDASKVYYQHWVAGVRGGGSGTNVFIHKSIIDGKAVDSIYFQNKIAKLEVPNGTNEIYTASFRRNLNQRQIPDLSQQGENPETIEQEQPFNLEDNEAVVSYIENDTKKYLKITNITKKEALAYPSAPRRESHSLN